MLLDTLRHHCMDAATRAIHREVGKMSVIWGILIIAFALGAGWLLANLIIPQSEIDKIDAIGKWAKEELGRREAERREE